MPSWRAPWPSGACSTKASAHGQEAIRIAEAPDHPFSLDLGVLGLAYLHGVRGELSQAVRLLERAVALSRDWNITLLAPIAMAASGSRVRVVGARRGGSRAACSRP